MTLVPPLPRERAGEIACGDVYSGYMSVSWAKPDLIYTAFLVGVASVCVSAVHAVGLCVCVCFDASLPPVVVGQTCVGTRLSARVPHQYGTQAAAAAAAAASSPISDDDDDDLMMPERVLVLRACWFSVLWPGASNGTRRFFIIIGFASSVWHE
jgi:hypothetical protein